MFSWPTFIDRLLHIGYSTQINKIEEIKLYILNAFLLIAASLTIIFEILFYCLGSNSAAEGLILLPIIGIVFYLNSIAEYKLARFITIYSFLIVVLFLAISDRRTGTEFLIIAIGCCSTIILEKSVSIIISFLFAMLLYFIYKWYDFTYPFTADPSIPYNIIENCSMFLSGFIVLSETLVFRHVLNKYALHLHNANDEITEINSKLTHTNEELQTIMEKLNLSIFKKNKELNAYMDVLNINLFVATSDLQGNVITINAPALEITGYKENELVNENFRILNSQYHDSFFFENMYRVINSGRSWRGEIKDRAKDGSYFWLDMVIMPVKDDKGKNSYFICIALPITERKTIEFERLRNVETVKTLASNASHRVRGPLTRILGLFYLMERHAIKPEEKAWVYKKIHDHIIELDCATSQFIKTLNKFGISTEKLIKAKKL